MMITPEFVLDRLATRWRALLADRPRLADLLEILLVQEGVSLLRAIAVQLEQLDAEDLDAEDSVRPPELVDTGLHRTTAANAPAESSPPDVVVPDGEIPLNTRLAKQILLYPRAVKAYSLSNEFRGEVINPGVWAFRNRRAMADKDSQYGWLSCRGGTCTAHVHSNLALLTQSPAFYDVTPSSREAEVRRRFDALRHPTPEADHTVDEAAAHLLMDLDRRENKRSHSTLSIGGQVHYSGNQAGKVPFGAHDIADLSRLLGDVPQGGTVLLTTSGALLHRGLAYLDMAQRSNLEPVATITNFVDGTPPRQTFRVLFQRVDPSPKPNEVTPRDARIMQREETEAAQSATGPWTIREDQVGDAAYFRVNGPHVDKPTFKALAAETKRIGGFYVRGAGFSFPTVVMAQEFVGRAPAIARAGAESASPASAPMPTEDRPPQPRPVDLAGRAAKLRAAADRLDEQVQAELGKDRQTNTARRASMAAHITQRALNVEHTAATMRRIADAIESGQAPELVGVTSRTQVDLLKGLLHRAQEWRDRESGKEPTMETTAQVKFPWPHMWGEHFRRVAPKIEGKPGLRQVVARLARRFGTEERSILQTRQEIEDLEAIATKLKDSADRDEVWIAEKAADALADYHRLARMGLDTPEKLHRALRDFMTCCYGAPRKESPIAVAERELIGAKIPGYFPTPRALADKVVAQGELRPGLTVLEPSAGKGDLAEAILRAEPGVKLSVIERQETLRRILEAKGLRLVGRDFLEHTDYYDRIIQNPPFEDNQDIDHVYHAFRLLNPGGILVSIMSKGPMFRQGKKEQAFRAWLEDHGAEVEDNPAGAFLSSDRPTGVQTITVKVRKPEVDEGLDETQHHEREDSDQTPDDAALRGRASEIRSWLPPLHRAILDTALRDGGADLKQVVERSEKIAAQQKAAAQEAEQTEEENTGRAVTRILQEYDDDASRILKAWQKERAKQDQRYQRSGERRPDERTARAAHLSNALDHGARKLGFLAAAYRTLTGQAPEVAEQPPYEPTPAERAEDRRMGRLLRAGMEEEEDRFAATPEGRNWIERTKREYEEARTSDDDELRERARVLYRRLSPIDRTQLDDRVFRAGGAVLREVVERLERELQRSKAAEQPKRLEAEEVPTSVRQMRDLIPKHQQHLDLLEYSLAEAGKKKTADIVAEIEKGLELAQWVDFYATLYGNSSYHEFAGALRKMAQKPKVLRQVDESIRAPVAVAAKHYVQAVLASSLEEAQKHLQQIDTGFCSKLSPDRSRAHSRNHLAEFCSLVTSTQDVVTTGLASEDLPSPVTSPIPSWVLRPMLILGSHPGYSIQASARPLGDLHGYGSRTLGVIDSVRTPDGVRWRFLPEGALTAHPEYNVGYETPEAALWGFVRYKYRSEEMALFEQLLSLPQPLPAAAVLAKRVERILPHLTGSDLLEARGLLRAFHRGSIRFDAERLAFAETHEVAPLERKASG